jgi:hypothetical protein
MFRKYATKKVVAVIMVFLMAAFLVPFFFDQGPTVGLNQTVASAMGEPITQGDFSTNELNTYVLSALRIAWGGAPWGGGIYAFGNPPIFANQPVGPEEYLLLVREARRTGAVAGPEEVKLMLNGLGVPNDYITRLQKNDERFRDERIIAAVSEYMTVMHAARSGLHPAPVSETQLRRYVRDTRAQVKVKVLKLDAERFVELIDEPSDEELEKHFLEFRERPPGGGLNFGYLIPDRVRVEYLMADASKFADEIKVTEDRARNYFRENKDRYERLNPSKQPLTQPAGEAPNSPPASVNYLDIKEQVYSDVQRTTARQRAKSAIEDAIEAAQKPWVGYDGGEGDQAPDQSKWRDYRKLAEEQSNESGIELEYVKTDLFSREEALLIPDIGPSRLDAPASAGGLFFADYVFSVKPFSSSDARRGERVWELGQDNELPFVVGDKYFLLRAIEAAPSVVPENLNSAPKIRNRVRDDWILSQAYALAEECGRSVAKNADDVGLDAAADTNGALGSLSGERPKVTTPSSFVRRQPISPLAELTGQVSRIPHVIGVGRSKVFVDRCFELAEKGEPGSVTTVGLPDMESFAVIEFLELIPVTDKEFSEARETAAGEIAAAAWQKWGRMWFSPESIRQRAQYKLLESQ